MTEADGHSAGRAHHNILIAFQNSNINQRIVVIQSNGDNATLHWATVRGQRRLLHDAFASCDHQELVVGEFTNAKAVGNAFAFFQRDHIDKRPSFGCASLQRQVVHLQPMHLASICEEQQEVMRA